MDERGGGGKSPKNGGDGRGGRGKEGSGGSLRTAAPTEGFYITMGSDVNTFPLCLEKLG